jgi:hypothetical protein
MKPLKYVLAAMMCAAGFAQQDTPLVLSILAGHDVSVSTREGRGADIRVRVTDSANHPVDNAAVTAILPAIGAGGSFRGGDTIKTKTSGSDGTVEFSGIRLRSVTGEIPIRIVARHGKQTGSTMVRQKATDVAPGPETRFSKRRLAMIAILAGGIAGAVVAATMNGDEPTQPAFNVTPGNPVTTGPR